MYIHIIVQLSTSPIPKMPFNLQNQNWLHSTLTAHSLHTATGTQSTVCPHVFDFSRYLTGVESYSIGLFVTGLFHIIS